MADCARCSIALPDGARFCPSCGAPLDTDATAVQELPVHETGPVPITVARAEPRVFGVTPATLLLFLAFLALVGAVLFFELGRLIVGIVLLVVTAGLLAGFLAAARRKPDSAVARAAAEAFEAYRARAGVAAESVRARSSARAELARLHRELLELAAMRESHLGALGDAVYRDDETGKDDLTIQLRELDELAAEKEAQMTSIAAQAQQRIQRAQLQVQPTEMVELPGEPYPPPDEGTLPSPAPVPEPYPPPDEGTLPQPPQIPEPEPGGPTP